MKVNILKEWTTNNGHKAYLVLFRTHINGYVMPNQDELKNRELSCCKFDYSIDDIPSDSISKLQKQINDIRVHGGLTYYDNNLFNDYAFGFDTIHAGDKGNYEFAIANTPDITDKELMSLKNLSEIESKYPITGDTWKNESYCENECESLSAQLKRIENDLLNSKI